jgi:hypothetical protein
MKTQLNATPDPIRRSSEKLDFEAALRPKIGGQDPAAEKVAEIYQMFVEGLGWLEEMSETCELFSTLRRHAPKSAATFSLVLDWKFLIALTVLGKMVVLPLLK